MFLFLLQSATKMETSVPPEDGLTWKLLGEEFSVYIPEELRGSWIKKCNGVFHPPTKAWRFLTTHIAEVERQLGLQIGESGIRDPRYHFKITFEATISGPDGFEKLRAELKERGIAWDRHANSFRASLKQISQVEARIAK